MFSRRSCKVSSFYPSPLCFLSGGPLPELSVHLSGNTKRIWCLPTLHPSSIGLWTQGKHITLVPYFLATTGVFVMLSVGQVLWFVVGARSPHWESRGSYSVHVFSDEEGVICWWTNLGCFSVGGSSSRSGVTRLSDRFFCLCRLLTIQLPWVVRPPAPHGFVHLPWMTSKPLPEDPFTMDSTMSLHSLQSVHLSLVPSFLPDRKVLRFTVLCPLFSSMEDV